MSKADGRQARAIQGLAAALQDCLDSAVERRAQRAEERIEAKFGPRFDKVDDTLRLFWEQFGGDEKIFRRDEVEGGTPVVESTAGAAEDRLLT